MVVVVGEKVVQVILVVMVGLVVVVVQEEENLVLMMVDREGWLQLVPKKDVVAQISCFVVVEKGMVDLVEVEVDGLQEGMVVAMQLVEEGKVVIEVGWIHVMLEEKVGMVLVMVLLVYGEVVEGDVVMVQEEPVVEVAVVVGLGLGSWLEQRRCFITG